MQARPHLSNSYSVTQLLSYSAADQSESLVGLFPPQSVTPHCLFILFGEKRFSVQMITKENVVDAV